MKAFSLTKSKYVRGLQCEKAMYLDVYQPRLARYSSETLTLFRQGRAFETTFRNTFPTGIDISKQLGRRVNQYPQLTQELLLQQGEVVLFEAGFLFNAVLVLADVVVKHTDGTVEVYEVKSGTEPKEVYRRDLAVQHYVISHCVPTLSHYYLLYNDGEGGFVKLDLTHEALQQHHEIAANVERFKMVLGDLMPTIAMGEHCEKPYECPYKHYCKWQTQTEI